MRRNITSPDVRDTPLQLPVLVGLQREMTPTHRPCRPTYVWTAQRRTRSQPQVNLTYNPATGRQLPIHNVSTRPIPVGGSAMTAVHRRPVRHHLLETAFPKRLSDGWQASATYTLGVQGLGPGADHPAATFPVPRPGVMSAPTMSTRPRSGEYGPGDAVTTPSAISGIGRVQRHLAAAVRLQMSGLYFFGSGQRFTRDCGGDLSDLGRQSTRLRPDGTIMPRNASSAARCTGSTCGCGALPLVGLAPPTPSSKSSTCSTTRTMVATSTAESTQLTAGRCRINVAYQPRMMQLGFRLVF